MVFMYEFIKSHALFSSPIYSDCVHDILYIVIFSAGWNIALRIKLISVKNDPVYFQVFNCRTSVSSDKFCVILSYLYWYLEEKLDKHVFFSVILRIALDRKMNCVKVWMF